MTRKRKSETWFQINRRKQKMVNILLTPSFFLFFLLFLESPRNFNKIIRPTQTKRPKGHQYNVIKMWLNSDKINLYARQRRVEGLLGIPFWQHIYCRTKLNMKVTCESDFEKNSKRITELHLCWDVDNFNLKLFSFLSLGENILTLDEKIMLHHW